MALNNTVKESLSERLPESVALSPEQRVAIARTGEKGIYTVKMEVEGPIDVSRLQTALNRLRERHVVLHTAFSDIAGYRGLRQQVQTQPFFSPLLFVEPDLEKDMPIFDLASGQTLRAILSRITTNRWKLKLEISCLAADRMSLATISNELTALYANPNIDLDAGRTEELFQYDQYVEWRHALEHSEEADQARSYWMQQMQAMRTANAPHLSYRIEPCARIGPARGQVRRHWPSGMADRIDSFARKSHTTIETTLQLAWWLLLGKLRGDYRFIGSWQHDCRLDYEIMKGSVGVFEKTLPVYVDVNPEQAFSTVLAQFSEMLAAHLDAQEYWRIDGPDAAATAVNCTVGFSLNLGSPASIDPRWRLKEVDGWPTVSELELNIGLDAHGNNESPIVIDFDSNRYEPIAMNCLIDQYLLLLEQFLDSPESTVAAVPLSGSTEPHINGGFPDNMQPVVFGDRSLSRHIAAWAQTTPDAPALESGATCLTYRELYQQVSALAGHLHAHGLKRGNLVALDMERSISLVIGLLAVWRLGAAYVVLDPQWPEARRKKVLEDARPVTVLSEAEVVSGIAAAVESTADCAELSDAAYVLYTSGSTGVPKGVVIEHGALLNYVAGVSQVIHLGASRRWALTGSVAADLGNTALFGALFTGGCLVIASATEMQDAESFSRFMRDKAIDGLKIVPSHLDALLECERPVLPKKLVLGGEATSNALLKRIAAVAPHCHVFNHYGPTETTVGVMVHEVTAGDMDRPVLPLSRVLPNCRVLLLDAMRRPVPVGASGELYIGGAQVCRGYLNCEPDDVFIDDPWLAGNRLYRTGDLGWLQPDGAIRLAGRVDHQLKIRGFRVDPSEVEAALLGMQDVRQAIVLSLEQTSGAVGLCAFLVMSTSQRNPDDDVGNILNLALAKILPSYMIPSQYQFMTDFVRLPNGKVNREALRVTVASAAASRSQNIQSSLLAPRDAVEFVLADCMASLLGRERIGLHDDFFKAGGHSLLVIKLAARIRKFLNVEIAPGLIFDHASVAALALLVRSKAIDPQQLERRAEAQRKLAQLTPAEREALIERAKMNASASV